MMKGRVEEIVDEFVDGVMRWETVGFLKVFTHTV